MTSHLDEQYGARMVDVSNKPISVRQAVAQGAVYLKKEEVLQAIVDNTLPKGNVSCVAKTAGILAAKRCDEIIPLCHTLQLDSVEVDCKPQNNPPRVEIEARVSCSGKTGVEMEALLAVAVAALAIYDMIKSLDRSAVIGDIQLMEKSGGKTGRFVREENQCGEKLYP